MDYDRNDALLHWLFRQTQGDAWFRPNEENISSGVALRVNDAAGSPEFRVFPYENANLEPFETAVAALNPVVAVKVRSAAVHAALAEVAPDERNIYVDAETRIQILETLLMLPQADREQCAAFIRDERVMVIWSESLDRIIPLCQEFEERLIKLLWRSRPLLNTPSAPHQGGVSGGSSAGHGNGSLVGCSGSPSVEVLAFSSGLTGNGNGGRHSDPPSLGHTNSFPINLLQHSSNGTGSSIRKGPYGEQGREFDELEMDEKHKDKLVSGFSHLNGHAHDQKMEDGEKNNKSRGEYQRTWYGKRVFVPTQGDDLEECGGERRPVRLYAPVYNGLAAGIALVFVGNGLRTLLVEWTLDRDFTRLALIAIVPLLYCVSLFFALQIVQNVTMMIGPIAHYHQNSKYYSAIPPRPNKEVDNSLPHITIQMPVYKESLETVLAPSIRSLKKAMQTYARQGGTSSIFINDDGLRLLPPTERDERLSFYANHNIGWVARPKHDPKPGGFKRAGRFKKASNMNYALALSLKAEKHLEILLANAAANTTTRHSTSSNAHDGSADTSITHSGLIQYGIQYQNRDGDESVVWGQGGTINGITPGASQSIGLALSPSTPNLATSFSPSNPPSLQRHSPPSLRQPHPLTDLSHLGDEDPEEKALGLAIHEVWEESGRKWRPWAANGRATRIGEIVLIVDSDTVVPEDCLRDAAREMRECPTVAIIQHESDVMQVAHHYFENGIAYFTKRINRCISISCANGEVAPFMGHNAFLRWKAIQDAVFVDPVDGKQKVWSESNVSEDFDMALRLMLKGYIVRWATYSKGAFKEGVSLSVDDELNRWQKYSYGCNELLFNPIVQWWRKGPINRQIHKFLWSRAPLHYKISMLAYMFSYYGIAASITISLINYVLLGFQFNVDGFFMHSFEIFLATTVVFWGSGTLGYTLLEYRLGHKQLIYAFFENIMWIPFFFFFFGGLSIPVTQAILAHLFSYNIQWSATIKEVQRSNFFKEIPKIARRFWFPMSMSIIIIAGMIILSTSLVPFTWRVDGTAWAVIFPLSLSVSCHILFPIVLNPWLMVFSY
ncbi:hypothetical protein BYT27DRAFT_7183930 [Phlegmacium glaucopus]|nr:hypothetical protein BYT27DRAFT_7183930 [Phlegmacium glaucopus]